MPFEWSKLWTGDAERTRHRWAEEARRLLPAHSSDIQSTVDPKEVTKVALRLRYQIEQVIPIELEESKITKSNSPVITEKVVQTAKAAGSGELRACVVYALLVCKRWFKKQAQIELWDSDLHDVRAVACEILAKKIIEGEEDEEYLMQNVLLKRYSIHVNGEETEPANAIERAVDLHALIVIGSSGYQKTIKYLYHGWIVQDDKDTGKFVEYEDRASTDYWTHFNPDRMRTPLYQNAAQIGVSIIYLALYTGAVNTVNEDGDLDVVEGALYFMTAGFVFDEISKFWKVGRYYLGFWNAFNSCLYLLLTASFVVRMIALSKPDNQTHSTGLNSLQTNLSDPIFLQYTSDRRSLNKLGYHIFAFSAPMFWLRLLLYLDGFRFFGAMLVVLKVMMRESLIFFALLIIVCIGFLQAFIGLNQADGRDSVSSFIVQNMINAVLTSPEFDGFDDYAHPFGLTLYYIFSFIVMTILLNILIALYNSAYEDITDNAIDEYMCLFAQKTMRFVRAPDENVFIAPFNLAEIFGLIIPFEWWMKSEKYERLNYYVMGVLYSPILLLTAWYEVREARRVKWNRRRDQADDDTTEEWEQMADELPDYGSAGWDKRVEGSKPDVTVDTDIVEMRLLRREVEELKEMLSKVLQKADGGSSNGK